MQINRVAFLLLFSFFGFSGFSQNQINDTITTTQLEEVVVTAQFEPQSIKKSVFNVRVINRQTIEQLAANNLADVLNQYLNISIRPSSSEGKSTISMFGLDGQYFKVLIDNVPIVSDSGLGNNIDLTQINLDDIEQIEIIEGSMGVTHGANAVSGVLNIITKKSSKNKWEISATVQEETVGDEYELAKGEGRHIQSLKISHKITDNWFVSLGGNRNDFGGFLDGRKGAGHAINNQQRGFTWLPKQQYMGNSMISYAKNGFRAFYRFDYLNENLDYYNPTVHPGFVPDFLKYSEDKRYLSERFYHHLNFNGLFSTINYNISFSHQKQTRETEDFRYFIDSGDETNLQKTTTQSMDVLYSTGLFSNFLKSNVFDLQLGYEITGTKGLSVEEREERAMVPITKRMESYDFFASSELKVTDKFSIRPGYRYSFQSKFDNQYASSLGFRYLFDRGIEVRASLGKSFRTPNFEELYSRIDFSGHKFFGNEDLEPEKSTSYEMSVKKNTFFDSGLSLSNSLLVNFLDVKDKIFNALIELNPEPVYQYINVNKYNMLKFESTHQLAYKNLKASAGISVVGVSQELNDGVMTSDDKYYFTYMVNSNVSYNIPQWNTMLSVNYKFNGKEQNFVADLNENKYVLSVLDSYSWLDGSVKKSFFKNQLDLTIGARNILNVKRSQLSNSNTGAAHASSASVLLGYGTSYFCKLTYNLNF